MSSFRRPESVLVLVYTGAAQVLVLARSDNPQYWQSVTGGLHAGELPPECALRELFEETGIQLPQSSLLTDHQCSSVFEIKGPWRARYHPAHTHNREHLFSVCLPAPVEVTLDPGEHVAFEWVPAERALQMLGSSTNRRAVSDIVLPVQHRRRPDPHASADS